MLTFEKVLEAFKDYLSQDEVCEVVLTSRGYTVMFWNEPGKEWYGVEYCETPERLRDELTSAYREFEGYKLTKGKGELCESDKSVIENKCNALLKQL